MWPNVGRRAAIWIGQAGLALVIGWFVWRRVADDWQHLDRSNVVLDVNVLWLVSAAALVGGTYGFLILAWRSVLRGWKQELTFPVAARIWTISNLGRYLPGKVWSIAGLAILAQREGVSGWAAGGAAIVMQALVLGTAAVVVAAVLPGTATPLSL